MIADRSRVELGSMVLRMFRSGLDTLEIAKRLRIFKPNGKPNEAKVCDLLHEARSQWRTRQDSNLHDPD